MNHNPRSPRCLLSDHHLPAQKPFARPTVNQIITGFSLVYQIVYKIALFHAHPLSPHLTQPVSHQGGAAIRVWFVALWARVVRSD